MLFRSNNWTPNNISLTAGTTYDSMIDVSYCTGQTGGTQPSGNYATLSPIDSFSLGSGIVSLSSGNLVASLNRTDYDCWARSTIAIPTSGKFYFEWTPLTVDVGTTPYFSAGVVSTDSLRTSVLGSTTYRLLNVANGNKYNQSSNAVYGAGTSTIPGTDIFQCAIDITNGNIYFGKNNQWGNGSGSWNQAFGSAAVAYSDLVSSGKTWMPFVAVMGQTTSTGCINFGQRPFSYTPPTGYSALCAPNLPTPTIKNGAGYMAATTYTGTGASQSVTNTVGSTSFKPDLVWIKSRSATTNNNLFDAIRGTKIGRAHV